MITQLILGKEKKEEIDFFIAKGIVDRIAEKLDIQFDYEAGEIAGLHPGRTAIVKLNGETIGFVGELHPKVEKEYDLKRTYVFELNYDKLMSVSVGYINYRQSLVSLEYQETLH